MKWIRGKVIAQKAWTPTLFSLYVEAKVFPFEAGQFVQISLEPESKLFKPYSFVNAPSDPLLEFYYDLIGGGKLTPALSKLTQGKDLWVAEKPAGRFVVSEVPKAKVLWLFATGTALGVFLSILKTDQAWEKFETIILIHSVRYACALTHNMWIEKWQSQYGSRFHWIPIVTQETEFPGLTERIPILLESGKLEKLLNIELSIDNSQVMLCGNPAMVTQVSHILSTRNFQLSRDAYRHITTESYWK